MTPDLALPAAAPAEPRWTEEFLDAVRREMDPDVDGIVRAYFESFPTPDAGRAALVALKKGYLDEWDRPMPADLPPAVRAFFDAPVHYPSWVDARRIDVASDLFLAYGPVSLLVLVLRSWSLFVTNPTGAHAFWAAQIFSRSSVAHQLKTLPSFILNFTLPGRLAQTLTTWPPHNNGDGLPPGVSIHKGRGIITIQKLRFAHAVQRILLTLPQPDPRAEWDWDRLGAPINQEALCQAMLHFCYSTIDGLAMLGIEQTEIEQDSTFMAWKTVLFLLGLRPELQPRDLAEGRRLLDILFHRNAQATPQAADLIRQELDVVRRLLPWGFGSVTAALMRYLIGTAVSDMLRIPNPRGLVWLLNATTWLWKGNRLLLGLIHWLSPRIIRNLDTSPRFNSF